MKENCTKEESIRKNSIRENSIKQNDLTQGNIFKTLILFAVPFLIANILQSLYGAVDLFVVGRYCSAESVAAISTGTQITQIVTSLITGLTLGGTILIGEYTGKKEFEAVRKTIGTLLTVFFCCGYGYYYFFADISETASDCFKNSKGIL